MNFKTTLCLVCMICFANLKGQTGGIKEVVYLKNGSIVKGIITEWVPNESISIQTADNSIFVFKINEIEKVKRER